MFEGKAIIISAPSGSGKTTIVHHLLHKFSFLAFSISATTRQPRTQRENHGQDYYFLNPKVFKEKVAQGDFVEWEEVYDGICYGTLKSEIERLWSAGRHVIFDVDVKGGINLKKYFGDRALAIFIKVPSVAVLEKRLRHRNTESEEHIQKRVAKARYELTFAHQFDRIIVSEKLEKTLAEAEAMVLEFINQ